MYESAVAHADRWDTHVCVTGGMRRSMGYSCLSHRWRTPLDGVLMYKAPMAHAARWDTHARGTDGTCRSMGYPRGRGKVSTSGRRAPGSIPDSIGEPPCKRVWYMLNPSDVVGRTSSHWCGAEVL
ncbi:hypothetical protein AVEN_185907-1 [Araneus ventricosus]|uniref:Uncharacterized protein n=1 Tax=Araneus ventricosus TaxID=182803 RepID=A0A4Y2U8U2_ARAVE|nr:hypothetical protein AVEN_125261-1 [Araneus ventricosus]GBO07918.1 hypothetical protein AVEN_129596-1 [Araneus ventricosus]GBO07987.1 hypothetical protein AVEN_75103-1 [Araneus ventricosus]GBO08007.1 hypothetical protein AVEN_185907-1 [Araneus ventricosus]